MAYDNSNSGVIFRNNKEGNEARPDYKGFAEIDGVKLEVAAWLRESKKDGSKFLSLKFTNKGEETGANRRESPPIPEDDGMGSDFPF